MDYEKAYKDLMEKVEAVKKDPRIGLKKGTYYNGYVQTGIRDALEYITTKESEEEKIRKAISAAICSTTAETVLEANGVKLVDAIAYLERQKDEAQKQFNLGIQAGREEVLYEMEKEQKPTKTSDEREYVRALKSIVSDFIRDKKPEDVSFYQEIYDWLDGRLIEQKPAEWSEEEEEKRKRIILLVEHAIQEMGGSVKYEEALEWLKSLRPQPHWKPSEEQIDALDAVYKTHYMSPTDKSTILNLLNDLKKLM